MGFFNEIRADPGFVSPVRSDPGFVSPIPSDPTRSGPILGFVNGHSERSNFTQVLPEFRVPINSFHVLPKVLKPYFESLEIAF